MADTISIRNDTELQTALHQLGATPGNRSAIIREAVLAYANTQRTHPTGTLTNATITHQHTGTGTRYTIDIPGTPT